MFNLTPSSPPQHPLQLQRQVQCVDPEDISECNESQDGEGGREGGSEGGKEGRKEGGGVIATSFGVEL